MDYCGSGNTNGTVIHLRYGSEFHLKFGRHIYFLIIVVEKERGPSMAHATSTWCIFRYHHCVVSRFEMTKMLKGSADAQCRSQLTQRAANSTSLIWRHLNQQGHESTQTAESQLRKNLVNEEYLHSTSISNSILIVLPNCHGQNRLPWTAPV